MPTVSLGLASRYSAVEQTQPMNNDDKEEIQNIRETALNYLHGKAERFRTHRISKRLDELQPKPITIEWLEAAILVRVAKRTQPTRTVNLMGMLTRKRAEQEEVQKFKDFEDQIAIYLHPYHLTHHAYTKARFSEADNTLALNHIGQLLERLEDMGYQAFLNSGTLLGVVREGRLIEHDDDIDLAIILKARTGTEAAREWVALLTQLKNIGLLGEARSGQNQIYKLNSVGEFEVDLFPCWIDGDKVFVYPHTFGDLERSQLLPLQKDAASGYPIPADPNSMLEINYGANWRISDPYFIFPWPQQKRLFQAFIADTEVSVDNI
tara:strand:+ start:2546 stop:3511 length:966 start_codon:yes stop_codon:yes gene_type:complete